MQSTLAHAQTAVVRPTTSNARKHVLPKSPRPTTNRPETRNQIQTNNIVSSKPVQEAGGGYDAKLVEMINSAIVDRSPSVKWEDVGEEFITYSLFLSIYFFFFYFWLLCLLRLPSYSFQFLCSRS